jgi:methylated-DNA-[protein]-cysteine S-methyltransferase
MEYGGPRPIGNANNKNNFHVIVPCHRVIAANKILSGYAGGIERKKWLLNHEGVKI